MLINPEKNFEVKEFLDKYYIQIDFFLPEFSKDSSALIEHKWAVVLEYILLKCIDNNILTNQLKEVLPDYEVEGYQGIKYFKLDNQNHRLVRSLTPRFINFYSTFFDNYLVNRYLLKRDLFSVKEDIDLKILFYLFGGEEVFQKQENLISEGRIYFNKDDFKEGDLHEKKLQILYDHLEDSTEEYTNCLLFNLKNHWVAVTDINLERSLIHINEPLYGRPVKIKINRRTPTSYYFYLYRYNLDNAIILKKDISKFLNEETTKEYAKQIDFLKQLVANFDKDIEKVRQNEKD
jgi:hypothetical protein